MLIAAVQLMKFQLHFPSLHSHRLSHRPDLGLRRWRRKCVRKPCCICNIGLELGLRGPKEDYAQMPNEISALNPELELRGLPGKLVQWRR